MGRHDFSEVLKNHQVTNCDEYLVKGEETLCTAAGRVLESLR